MLARDFVWVLHPGLNAVQWWLILPALPTRCIQTLLKRLRFDLRFEVFSSFMSPQPVCGSFIHPQYLLFYTFLLLQLRVAQRSAGARRPMTGSHPGQVGSLKRRETTVHTHLQAIWVCQFASCCRRKVKNLHWQWENRPQAQGSNLQPSVNVAITALFTAAPGHPDCKPFK